MKLVITSILVVFLTPFVFAKSDARINSSQKDYVIEHNQVTDEEPHYIQKRMLEKNIEIDYDGHQNDADGNHLLKNNSKDDLDGLENGVLPSRDSIDIKSGPSYYRAMLGKATWRLLHTMAAKYPENPTSLHQVRTLEFLILLSQLYPCDICSDHFQELISIHPPVLSSQKEFSEWLCFFHNTVNGKLGKPMFECNENVDSEYDCGCDSETECPFLK